MKPYRLSPKLGLSVVVLAASLPGGGFLFGTLSEAVAADPPKKVPHRVVAYYFHRTVRCNTCKTISAYTEEAIKKGLAKEVKAGAVSLYMVDFQNKKNRQYAKYYKITGPTLVVTDVRDGKLKKWKTLPDVWALVFEKKKFLPYVEGEIRGYLEAKE